MVINHLQVLGWSSKQPPAFFVILLSFAKLHLSFRSEDLTITGGMLILQHAMLDLEFFFEKNNSIGGKI